MRIHSTYYNNAWRKKQKKRLLDRRKLDVEERKRIKLERFAVDRLLRLEKDRIRVAKEQKL